MSGGIQLRQNGVALVPTPGAHPPPITIAAAELCYLSFEGSPVPVVYSWSLAAPSSDPGAVISSPSSPGPTFLPEIDGAAYSVTLIDENGNTYVLDIVVATVPIAPSSGGILQYVTTIAGLRTLVASSANAVIYVRCYATLNDGGGGNFHWNATNNNTTRPDNGGTIIVPTVLIGGTGCWERDLSVSTDLDARWFGAVGDGVTDARASIVATIAALPATGGHVALYPGTYLWSGAAIDVPDKVTLFGKGKQLTVTLKYTGADSAAVKMTSTTHARLVNLELWSTQTDCVRLGCAGGQINERSSFYDVQFIAGDASVAALAAGAANAAVYCIGNTGGGGAGFVYWPSFDYCTFIGPNTGKSAAIRTAKTGNGTLFLSVFRCTMEVFGRHLELNVCSNARIDEVTHAGCLVTLPITAVDIAANTLTSAGHPFAAKDVVQVHSDGTVPTGIPADTDVYVLNPTANAVQVSLTPGGAAIDITGAGTGTITFSKIGRYVYFGTAGSCVVNLPHSELAGAADRIVEFADGSSQCWHIDGSSPEYANVVGAKAPHVAGSSNMVGGFTQTTSADANICPYPANFTLLLQDQIKEKTPGHGVVIGCANAKTTEFDLTQALLSSSTARFTGGYNGPAGNLQFFIGDGFTETIAAELIPRNNGNDNVARLRGTGANVVTTNATPTKVLSTLDLNASSQFLFANDSAAMIEFDFTASRNSVSGGAAGAIGDCGGWKVVVMASRDHAGNLVVGTPKIDSPPPIGVTAYGVPTVALDGTTGVKCLGVGGVGTDLIWGGYITITKVKP